MYKTTPPTNKERIRVYLIKLAKKPGSCSCSNSSSSIVSLFSFLRELGGGTLPAVFFAVFFALHEDFAGVRRWFYE